MFPFGGYFLHLAEQSCGNWRGRTVGKIAACLLHRRKYWRMLCRLAKIVNSSFVGFVVVGDALQWTSRGKEIACARTFRLPKMCDYCSP
jgi:hypothetical protein